MKIFITNLGKYVEGYLIGKWVQLPIDEDVLAKVLEAIGINEYYEEYFITDYETEIVGVGNSIGEYSSLTELNRLAERLESLDEDDEDKLEAVLEYTSCRGVRELLELIDELESFEVTSGQSFDCTSLIPETDVRLTCTASQAYASITIGTVTITSVAQGDVLVVDGINKRILQNGGPCAGNMSFVHFPKLVPGLNTISCPETMTVEYYPTY